MRHYEVLSSVYIFLLKIAYFVANLSGQNSVDWPYIGKVMMIAVVVADTHERYVFFKMTEPNLDVHEIRHTSHGAWVVH